MSVYFFIKGPLKGPFLGGGTHSELDLVNPFDTFFRDWGLKKILWYFKISDSDRLFKKDGIQLLFW